ncbi:unnamed protein product [Mycena citricolor]|uniref:Uncharacterized protein n=1 Tax=Mycena citricolor TaxID=2018698 RepID=A0AAD2HJB2_9AGAR|nr:unnamed protein product [Mycena citricolor]
MHIVRLPELLALALVISDIPFSVCAARCLGRGCLSSDDTPQRRDSTLHSRSLSHPNMIAVVAGVVAGVSVFLFAILVVILVVQSRRDKIQKVDTEGAVQLETAKPEFATLVPQAKPSTAVEHAASRLPQSVPFVSEWPTQEPLARRGSFLSSAALEEIGLRLPPERRLRAVYAAGRASASAASALGERTGIESTPEPISQATEHLCPVQYFPCQDWWLLAPQLEYVHEELAWSAEGAEVGFLLR